MFKSPLNKIALSLMLATGLTACSQSANTAKESAAQANTAAAATNVEQFERKAAKLTPYQQRDFRDEVFYFVLPDRFYNGDPSNDMGAAEHDTKRTLSRGGLDVTHKGMYHGGDLAGLTKKLPYLDNMGITAIWLTPVLRNRAMQADTSGYHGYWILDFTEIDPHWGSNAELKNFIDQAHERNIKVYFDIITNHTADVIKYEQCHGKDGLGWLAEGDRCQFKDSNTPENERYKPLLPKGEEAVKVPAWLNDIDLYNNQGDSHWSGESSIKGDFAGLDDVDTTQQKVVDGMIDIYKNLITEFKPDGFRIDTVKHVDMSFWDQFSPALMEHAASLGINNFMMYGEAYSFEPELLSTFLTEGKMPSVLDFALQGSIEAVVVNQKGTSELTKLFAKDHLYKHEDGFNANHLVSFTGNHDMGRIAYRLKSSEFNYSESEMVERTLLAHALMYFSRGVPVIYYGDEQGFVGDGGDQDSRQNMMPSLVETYNDDDLLATDKTTADDNFDTSHLFYQRFAEYAELYQAHIALRQGEQSILFSQDEPGLFAIKRAYQGEQGKQNLAVIFNTSTKSQSIKPTGMSENAKLIYQSAEGEKGQVAGLGFSVYQLD
ncbi:alpha-amylase family glycosyl hydrolase [Pseudoalteromonas phenolica]|nr:alpha-amylase family glycosyl hydrolase [Pseudoalteromonas phenolica]